MDRFENVIDSEIVIGNEVVVEQVLSSEPINAVKVPMPIELQDKEVEPTINEQVITADKGFSGLGTVKVGAVTSDIDENITARNIRGGVTILGVTGDLEPDKPNQSKSVFPTTEKQIVKPDPGYELEGVEVGAVTSDIDKNIQSENIKSGIEILGITGTFNGDPKQFEKTFNLAYAKQMDIVREIGGGNPLVERDYTDSEMQKLEATLVSLAKGE